MNPAREYDITLLGATGFTGKLIAQYLNEHRQKENIRIALAGRNETSLSSVLETLPGQKIALEVCDVENHEQLIALCRKTNIVMNTVGPFSKNGKNVIKACIEAGTHYLDITGEPSFVADIFTELHMPAKNKGVCIVNCCGFDSIPADFTTWMTAKALPHDNPMVIDGFVRTNAQFSGGTLNTAIEMLYLESKKSSIKYKVPRHPDTPKTKLKIHKNRTIDAWAIPMPVVDPHIVKRSIYHLPLDYGYATAYRQFFVRSTFFKMLKTILPVSLAYVLVKSQWFRNYIKKKYPPGSGPTLSQRNKSFFEFTAIGQSGDTKVTTKMKGGDPGYTETSKMFSQAAFCLLDKIKNGHLVCGVCTPVQAFGNDLLKRLELVGIHVTQVTEKRVPE